MRKTVLRSLIVGLMIVSVFLLGACGSNSKTNSSASGKTNSSKSSSTGSSGSSSSSSSDSSSGSSSSGSSSSSPYDLSKVHSHTIKAGIGLNADTPEGKGLAMFKKLVEQYSGGKIKVDNFYSAQLGDDLKMTQALQSGTQEVTIPSTSPLVGIVPQFGLFDLPYTFNNAQEAYAVLDGPVGQKILDKLKNHNLVGLGYWENGFRDVTNSKHPITKASDFKGLKLRVMQDEVFISAFKALGVNPTPLPFSEVFNALQSHTVDGQENPFTTILSNKFYEVQKYVSKTDHVYTPFVFLISKKFWDQLDPTEQKIVQDAEKKAQTFQRKDNEDSQSAALAQLKKDGMQVSDFPDSEKAKVVKKLQPVIQKYANKFGIDLYNQMEAQIKKIRGQ